MRPATDRARETGFTLVEMIVSIVISGILIAMVGMFGRWQIQSYFDISSRAALVDAGDTAIRRLTRDLQTALPNSVRVDPSNTFIEFIPIRDAGRYRADTGGGVDSPLDFGISATATRFDVLGLSVTIAAGPPADQVVIYNLGIAGADAYAAADNRRSTSITGAGLSQVTAAAAFKFPFASPANRFQVVGNPVTFQCDAAAGVIRRYWNYGFLAAQPVAAATMTGVAGSASAILVNNVQGCPFTYTPGVFQRNGLVSIALTLAANGETVRLMNQVEILNTP